MDFPLLLEDEVGELWSWTPALGGVPRVSWVTEGIVT